MTTQLVSTIIELSVNAVIAHWYERIEMLRQESDFKDNREDRRAQMRREIHHAASLVA